MKAIAGDPGSLFGTRKLKVFACSIFAAQSRFRKILFDENVKIQTFSILGRMNQ
jgi:hypothetical protein